MESMVLSVCVSHILFSDGSAVWIDVLSPPSAMVFDIYMSSFCDKYPGYLSMTNNLNLEITVYINLSGFLL